ncbi:ABC transporter ATP-binding protein [Mesorhizobium sp. M0435]|uniref:ABC transporter ATP-binding protein n=1 Tax=Mesorhizobium sp. M0435 TaxID=2956944 RepID=UPI0033353C7C
MTVLSIEGLKGGYSEVDILNGIDLMLNQGEILTIAGTNGAGKSTVAKAVVGLLPRVSGSVRLEGKDITFMAPESRAQNGIGYVPQVANIFPSLTIIENLEVVKGVQDRKARIGEMFRLFPALADRKRSRAGRLSGGERQQLAYARALMTRPKVVVLDEPTAALSPTLVADSFARIASLASDGTSILLIEQRARQALAISDRGAIMDGGRIAMEGPASELLNNEKAADLYLGHYST